jgi:hypothetical protein
MQSPTIPHNNGTAKQKLSDEWKEKELYLRAELDNTILTCSDVKKEKLMEAYTIRNGKRSTKKFEYLQQAYGIFFPAKIRHIPVLKSMFDAIAAIDQTTPLDFKVTSKDVESLKTNQNDAREAIIKGFVSMAKQKIEDAAEFFDSDKRGESPAPPEKTSEREMKSFLHKIHGNFKSDLEINAQDFLESMIQRLELEVLKSIMIEDLITAGSEYYQVKALEVGKKPLVRVINPLNVFYRKDPEKKFLKDHSRVLLKEKITIQDLLMNHGHKMDKEAVKRLMESKDINIDSGNKFWRMIDMSYTALRSNFSDKTYDELFDTEVDFYYGEWMANTEIEYEDSYVEKGKVKYEKKRKYRKDRFEGYRVNEDIYFGLQKSDFIYRPTDDPYNCFLTINGVSYNDRNGEPYSLVLNTEDIADKMDMLHYIWESMIAMSGNKAAVVNYKAIPKWLSNDPKDRVFKWLGMVKTGAAIVDPSQPGAKDFHNTGQIDMSIDQSINVILEMIQYLEEVAGKITGVSRQLMGSIKSDDLNGTTKMAMNQSSMVLMPFMFTHHSLMKHMLTDVINVGRLCYENGFMSSYIHGDINQKIFSIDNEKFWLADFDVWLSNSGDEHKSIEELKALSFELVKANQIDAMDAVNMNTIKSLTKIKEALKRSIMLREDSQVDELQQQLAQIQEEMQKVMKDLEKVDQAKMRMNERELQLKERELNLKYSQSARQIENLDDFNMKKIDLEKKRVELESLQLAYSDNAKEIKNS